MRAAAIFDMDGLLMDSEPLWAQAEVEILGSLGVPLTLERCRETRGVPIEEVVALRHREAPWPGPTIEEVSQAIILRVVDLVRSRGRPMRGAGEALDLFHGMGWRVGLATSSDPRILDAFLDALDLRHRFHHVQSARGLVAGKPHPAVYLAAARGLGVEPRACVALEDSVPGVLSALAAGMRVIAVPDPELAADPRFQAATWRIGSLEEVRDLALGPAAPPCEEPQGRQPGPAGGHG